MSLIGVSHIATMTGDLERFRAFYEDVIGLRTTVVLRMAGPPSLRHAFLYVDDTCMIHVFEQPGYDPIGDGIRNEIGQRGRIDHLGFLVTDTAELERVRDRLVAAGASDGKVIALGPLLSVWFRDPDGLEGEVNAPNPAFDPTDDGTSQWDDRDYVEEQPDPGYYDRLITACGRKSTM